jgi:serine/threonine protein kinase
MDEIRLEYFLDKFHSDKTSGKDPVVTELCRDYPELADELARRIGVLQRFEKMADSIGDDLTAPAEVPQPDSAITANPFRPVGPVWPVVPGYEILAELGRGGMGVVYKARQTHLHRLVALKMILSGNQARAVELMRFRAEAEALAQLKHPNIVHIHEIGENAGAPFFSMEFVEGGSLAQTLDGKVMPPQKAAKMVQLLANAIHAAHLLQIVHRDLKPENILLQPDGTPKISDFGLAKRLDTGEGLTHSGDILGSPAYMAPEQAGGKVRNIGPETDVYSLGAILYTMLTGRPPFLGLTVVDVILHVLSQVPIPPRRLQPLVSPELEAICLKCLEKAPHQRYASAAELADDLENFLHGKPTHRPSSAWNRLELELYCKNIALAEREWSSNQYQNGTACTVSSMGSWSVYATMQMLFIASVSVLMAPCSHQPVTIKLSKSVIHQPAMSGRFFPDIPVRFIAPASVRIVAIWLVPARIWWSGSGTLPQARWSGFFRATRMWW